MTGVYGRPTTTASRVRNWRHQEGGRRRGQINFAVKFTTVERYDLICPAKPRLEDIQFVFKVEEEIPLVSNHRAYTLRLQLSV